MVSAGEVRDHAWAGPWWFADIYKELVAEGERGYGSIVKTILATPNCFIKTLLTEPKFIYALHFSRRSRCYRCATRRWRC